MAQRLVKIILPEDHGKAAQEMLRSQESLSFWQEESADGNSVISALTDSGSSEKIMDLFEKTYSSVSGFQIVLLPVEASIPRTDIPEDDVSASSQVKINGHSLYGFAIREGNRARAYGIAVICILVNGSIFRGERFACNHPNI